MPRISGGSPSSSPITPRGNETPRHGTQGSSNTKHRSFLGSIGAALGNIGRPRKSSSSGSASGSHSTSPSASPPRGAAPGTPARGQSARAPIDTLRERGVDLQGLREAIAKYMSLGIALPPHFQAALHHAGVSTELELNTRDAIDANHPLLALSNKIYSELRSSRPAATPPRPAGLTRSPGLRRRGETSPPQGAQAAPVARAHSPARGQTNQAPLETLRRAGIDPHEFNTAVANFMSFGNDFPPNIVSFLRNAGIPHDITEGFHGSHPLLAFDQQVRVALRNQTPAAPRSRPAGNTPARPTPTLRRPTPAPLDSADFDQSAAFSAPQHNVGPR